MTATRRRPVIIVAGLLLSLLAVSLHGVQAEELDKVPSEDQCRPYIEKALKDLGAGSEEQTSLDGDEQEGVIGDGHFNEEQADEDESASADTIDLDDNSKSREKRSVSVEETSENELDQVDTIQATSLEDENEQTNSLQVDDSNEEAQRLTDDDGDQSTERDQQTEETVADVSEGSMDEVIAESSEQKHDETSDEVRVETAEDNDIDVESSAKSTEDEDEADTKEESDEKQDESGEKESDSTEDGVADESEEIKQSDDDNDENDEKLDQEATTIVAEKVASIEQEPQTEADDASEESGPESADDGSKQEEGATTEQSNRDENEKSEETAEGSVTSSKKEEEGGMDEEEVEEAEESTPEEEELTMEIEIPEVLRARDHIGQLLKLDEENEGKEKAVEKIANIVLRDLKRLYDNAIKPLENLYKYRDLSNRHFGDPEIFSKPLVLFMGPWSGGKSSIINYLLDIEYKPTSLRTGAEPSPAYFNILMHGEEEEVLDGTQLAADWTFSGLQKFGQGLLDRLKGYKLNNKLLEKVNIVEIPGILEIRKQVQRLFPFNDACQWFIDRADIIFLVYDPSKLDVGPETEAILDQLKGREYQTRIILNKADQVKPEELMRVQGALIWNISPLMSSAEPPIMYSTSLWSIPYEAGAPTRLLYAQERALLRDLRSAVDKRVEHKIASARRFAVRVRNHAKMVDCYLTTYYNHKSFFAKKKDVSDRIIESPQDYHIYEGLSTLTNISRYDLPDPDVYRDFFRLNNLYEFPLLSSTCTYFRGCPINRLDVAIAYDLPELVGKYKKSAEAAALRVEEVAATAMPVSTPQAQSHTQKAKSGASTVSLS